MDSRLDHLTRASDFLSVTSPALSAHLQSARHSFITATEGLPTSTNQRDGHTRPCSSCGSILLLGWNCRQIYRSKISNQIVTRTRQDRVKGLDVQQKSAFWQCERCGAENAAAPRPPRKARPSDHAAASHVPLPREETVAPRSAVTAAEPPAPDAQQAKATAGSRKRARKNKSSGLEALLASRRQQQQQQAATSAKGFGLDLMDFMKT